jgi:hypothetical protein
VLNRAAFLLAVRQLAAAAELLASTGPEDFRIDALQMLALFRRQEQLGAVSGAAATRNDDLFASTGQAALTLVGRHEFAASHALLKQAQSLLVLV